MTITSPVHCDSKAVRHDLNASQSTLYELIEAISEELTPRDDQLVADIVIDLFESGRVKFNSWN